MPEEREAAAIAGLLHDSAKLMRPPDLLSYCEAHHVPLDELDRRTSQTLHAFAGAELVRETFGIGNSEILNAIRYHTTGRIGMSRVEKIVYVADKIEERTRNPQFIRDMSVDLDFLRPWSLDLTMLRLLDSTMRFLMEKHQLIHTRTLEARNDLLGRLRDEKRL